MTPERMHLEEGDPIEQRLECLEAGVTLALNYVRALAKRHLAAHEIARCEQAYEAAIEAARGRAVKSDESPENVGSRSPDERTTPT